MASIPVPRRYRTVVYIPSRHDDNMLEVCLSIPTNVSSQPQCNTGIVIAHPYGPLGGAYNNNVVGALLQWFETNSLQATTEDPVSSQVSSSSLKRNSAGSTHRKQNLDGAGTEPLAKTTAGLPKKSQSSSKNRPVPLSSVICAFNFRGCGKSKGKTSWTGEAEREDYQTIIDFLQSGSHSGSSQLKNTDQHDRDSGSSTPGFGWNGKIYNELGREIDAPRLPFMSRFILSGYSYGAMIASTIPPPLRNPAVPSSGHLPTSYILVSYPAGVAWFLTSGAQGSFYKRARAILQGEYDASSTPSSSLSNELNTEAVEGDKKQATVEAYFITGTQDQFTSTKTLLTWLKTNTSLDPPKQVNSTTSWALKRPDGVIHLDVVENVDHFWMDQEQELLDRVQSWWSEAHPTADI
ncbi:hypothetical protein EDD21DRAFT_372744 [Dissophora ornata]|nr:hypothetical protein EDD21DRAFT_372744 [Dissophora ornata]